MDRIASSLLHIQNQVVVVLLVVGLQLVLEFVKGIRGEGTGKKVIIDTTVCIYAQ